MHKSKLKRLNLLQNAAKKVYTSKVYRFLFTNHIFDVASLIYLSHIIF